MNLFFMCPGLKTGMSGYCYEREDRARTVITASEKVTQKWRWGEGVVGVEEEGGTRKQLEPASFVTLHYDMHSFS